VSEQVAWGSCDATLVPVDHVVRLPEQKVGSDELVVGISKRRIELQGALVPANRLAQLIRGADLVDVAPVDEEPRILAVGQLGVERKLRIAETLLIAPRLQQLNCSPRVQGDNSVSPDSRQAPSRDGAQTGGDLARRQWRATSFR
jgi:hypothetical protein